MRICRLLLSGLAFLVFVGCQSYFPNGYGNGGAYPNMSQPYVPQGSTGPSASSPRSTLQPGTGQLGAGQLGTGQIGTGQIGTGQFPTPANGQKNSPARPNSGQSQSDKGQVPKYGDPATPPSNLGTPSSDDDDDSINRGSGGRDSSSRRAVASDDEVEVASLSDGEERFLSPTKYRPASADDADMGHVASRPRPSPYKKDPNGYKWLRGVVSRDAVTNSWRITYSRDPLDNDPYGGSLTLVDSPLLDKLMDDDVVYAKGDVDPSSRDRYNKPSYRATGIWPLIPKDN
jgi:hypothetical protein